MKAHVRPDNEIPWPRHIVTPAEAVKYINAVGYCMLLPVKSMPLPSLYFHVTRRNRLQKKVWDKYSIMVWRWKDELPGKRRAFYAKYFRGRGTFISLAQLPNFLAMRDAAVAADDHGRFYSDGRIREDARLVWEALATHGPLATLELRNACKLDTKTGNVRFKRAILELQCLLIAVHSGSEQETGAWASGRYELTCRAFPKETVAARQISLGEARRNLAAKFLKYRSDAAPAQLARLFGWSKEDARAALESAKEKSR
jgi:Winged helix DNA-binding domain